MATIYCPECGYKNEYTLHAPKFCGGCGVEMGSPSTASSSRSKPNSKRRKLKKPDFMTSDDPDETDSDHVPDIKKLDVDISYEGQARVFRGEDLASIPEESSKGRTSS